MLKNHYDMVLVGHNYISLIYGIKSLKQGKSVVLIDDPDISFAHNWSTHFNYLERETLRRIGESFHIQPLKNIDNYLQEENLLFYLDDKMIESSDSPYLNLKEIARKLPESFSIDIDSIDQNEFDQKFFELLDFTSKKGVEKLGQINNEDFFKDNSSFIQNLLEDFSRYFSEEKLKSNQLHFLLQMMFQTVFSSGVNSLESNFLATSWISPQFKLGAKELCEDLLFEYRRMGGDLKRTEIAQWGLSEGSLKSILLSSVDGLINLDELFFFGQLMHKTPFDFSLKEKRFLSLNLEFELEHKFSSFLKRKRVICSQEEVIGSDFPYWEFSVDDKNKLLANFVYADYEGTKPSFHYSYAESEIYKALTSILPGLSKSDWYSGIKLTPGEDLWVEYMGKKKDLINPLKLDPFSDLIDKENRKKVKSLHYCGPRRGKSMGLFSYLLDVFSY